MAIDNTPPRLQLIITIAVITIISLIGIDFVLRSYYGYMDDDAKQRKLAPTTALDDQHKAEKAALTSANLDQSMAQLAKGSRTDIVKPTQSEDMGPMTGWSKLPKPAPTPDHGGAHATAPTGGGGAGGHDMHAAGDGGAPHADGGAATHTTHGTHADAGAAPRGDAGAPKPIDAGAQAPKGAPHP
jgi:hypothetical protein